MGTKRVVAVIPARMGASRFPGKPLASILGLPLVEHVRRRVALSPVVDEVVVATCDQAILDAVLASGGKAVMTKDSHERCTDRVEEAALGLELDIAVVVQGDEPLFDPAGLELLVRPLLEDSSLVCSNLISVIRDEADWQSVDVVKAIMNEKGFVMAFSRAPIPHRRVPIDCPLYRQTGVSAFTKGFLHTFSRLPPTALEITESVDFMRILGHGYPIRGVLFDGRLVGVDRPGDVAVVEEILRTDPVQRAYFERIMAQ